MTKLYQINERTYKVMQDIIQALMQSKQNMISAMHLNEVNALLRGALEIKPEIKEVKK